MGQRRIGLALSDATGSLATPLGYILRTKLNHDIEKVLGHALEWEAGEIIVGMPFSLNGQIGPQARKVHGFVRRLQQRTDLPVTTVDERFSTAEAERMMRQAGRKPSRHKGEVDAAAAAVILQEYLDKQKAGKRS